MDLSPLIVGFLSWQISRTRRNFATGKIQQVYRNQQQCHTNGAIAGQKKKIFETHDEISQE